MLGMRTATRFRSGTVPCFGNLASDGVLAELHQSRDEARKEVRCVMLPRMFGKLGVHAWHPM